MEAFTENEMTEASQPLTPGSLWSELARLDGLLERAVVAARNVYGADSLLDRFRGLHIAPEETERLLSRQAGVPLFNATESNTNVQSVEFTELAAAYGLSRFELDVVLIALAPELDLRYERLYAYLQDDVTKRRPTVDLALNLLCHSLADKAERRAFFAPEAPLLHHGLLQLLPDPHQLQPPLLAHYLKLDEQIVRWLLRDQSLDERLAPYSKLFFGALSLAELPLPDAVKQPLAALAHAQRNRQGRLLVYLQNQRDSVNRSLAEAVAGEAGLLLLAVDVSLLAARITNDFEQRIRLLLREADIQGAALFFENLDALQTEDRALPLQNLLRHLAESHTPAIFSGSVAWGTLTGSLAHRPLGVVPVVIPPADFTERKKHWQTHLELADLPLEEVELDKLAGRFRLKHDHIAEAVAVAQQRLRYSNGKSADSEPTVIDNETSKAVSAALFAAARAQSSQSLHALAWKIEPRYTWNDIVLPSEAMTQMQEICSRVAEQQRVLGEWGFGRKLAHGKGVSALFVGPSGTGKTMAAEIIAHELGLDLFKIDLSGIVSKYIGETEKNLDRIFAAAEAANAILFFDEADALFGKRSEVRDAHDRYANIETSYLLQKMEQYEGIAILATNLRQNMDEAFTRRLQFIVEFPFPDETQRKEIWQNLFPREAPREENLDFDFLAKQFRIAGGNIKNVVLGAAFLAASNGGRIGMQHLVRAAQREHQKMGRVLNASDLGNYFESAKGGKRAS